MTAPARSKVQRILVPLDVSSEARAGLVFAARLARALESHLEGLFIEDQDLVALAGLPFTSELCLTGGPRRTLDPDRLRREFKARAAAAERLLAEVAKAERVSSSFRTARGKTEVEITAAVRQGDLLTVGRALGAVVSHGAQGGAVRLARRPIVGSILLTGHRPTTAPRTVEAVYAGTPDCDPALRLADRLAAALGARLVVTCPAPAERGVALSEEVGRILERDCTVHVDTAQDRERLLASLCARPDRLVVAARTVLDPDSEASERLAGRIACPLLLVHPAADQPAEAAPDGP